MLYGGDRARLVFNGMVITMTITSTLEIKYANDMQGLGQMRTLCSNLIYNLIIKIYD